MGLKDFLYRCPFCGHDPLEGKGLAASCPSCARTYAPGAGRTGFRVGEPGGKAFEVAAHELARRVDAFGGPWTRAKSADGRVRFQSAVTARFSRHEDPLRHRGVFLGFVEQYGPPMRGTLELTDHRLRFEPVRGEGRAMELLELRALQASSSSIQVSYGEKGVDGYRFEGESAYRWERLLKQRLREVWAEAGRGTIVEFQPRIRCG